MSSVDNRVVKMSFDNAEFEKNARTTLGTLDKLKQSLDFSGATKGMGEIQSSVNNINFDGMASSLDFLQNRFSVFGEFVHNTLTGVLNKAIEVGKSIANALVIEPAKQGFEEYELQMNSVQTIMSSTGESVETVNRYLDELNTYADKTIYSFSDMTSSVGKFTNAGVDLNTAVAAIQGISNAAALAGADTRQASSAMFNLSQALSAGYLGLIDWRSISLTAGIGTEKFRQTLIDTALAMGTLVEENGKYISTTTDLNGKVSDAFGVFENFDNSLSHRWATKDVIMQAMANFGTDVREMTAAEREAYEQQLLSIYGDQEKVQSIIELGMAAADAAKDVKTFSQLIDTLKESLGSGWTKSWQLIIGDLEEAKALWTEVNDILGGFINKTSDARNALLESWADAGGRTAIIDGLRNAFEALASRASVIGAAWSKIFQPLTSGTLVKYSNDFKNFTESLKPTDQALQKLGTTATQLFRAIRQGYNGFVDIGAGILNIIKSVSSGFAQAFNASEAAKILKEFTDRFADLALRIKNFTKNTDELTRFFKGLFDVARALGTVISDVVLGAFDGFMKVIDRVLPSGKTLAEMLGMIGDRLTQFAQNLTKVFGSGDASVIRFFFDTISTAISDFLGVVSGTVNLQGAANNFKSFFASLDFSSVSQTVANLKTWFESLLKGFEKTSTAADNTAKAASNTNDKIGVISESLKGISQRIANEFKPLADKLSGLKDFLMNFADMLKSIPVDTIARYVTLFVSSGLLTKFIDMANTFPDKIEKVATTLPGKIKELTKDQTIPELVNQLKTGIKDLTGVLTDLRNVLQSYTKLLNAASLLAIAAALAELAVAAKMISDIPSEKLASSFAALGAGIAEIMAVYAIFRRFSASFKDLPALFGNLVALFTLSQSIGVVADALVKVGQIDSDKLGPAVAAVGGLLLEIVGYLKLMENVKFSSGTPISLLVAAQAINQISGVFMEMSKLDFEQVAKGLAGIGGLLAEFAIFSNLMPKESVSIKNAATIALIAAALNLLVVPLRDIGSLPFNSIAKGLIGIGGALAEFVVALNFMPSEGKLISSAAAMVIMSAALVVLSEAVKRFGNLSMRTLAKGLGSVMAALILLNGTLQIVPDSGPLIKATSAMILMAAALEIVADVCEKFSKFSAIELVKGFLAIGSALTMLVLALNMMPTDGSMLLTASSLVIMAASLDVLYVACKLFSTMSLEELFKGFVSIAAGLTILGVAAENINGLDLAKLSVGVALMGAALVTLIYPLHALGSMSIKEIAKSLIVVSGALVVFGVAAEQLDAFDLAKTAAGIALMGGALLVLSQPLTILGSMSINEIANSLIAIAGAFVVLGIASEVLDGAKIGVLGLDLLMMSAGVLAMANAIAVLGTLDFGSMVTALVGLAGALGVLWIASTVFANPATAMGLVTFAGSLLAIGAAAILLAAALGAISAVVAQMAPEMSVALTEVLNALTTNLPLMGDVIVAFLAMLAETLVTSLDNIKTILVSMWTALVESFGEAFMATKDTIVLIFGTLFDMLLTVLNEKIPILTETILNLLLTLAQQMLEYVPRLHEIGIQIILSFLQAIADNIQSVVEAAISIGVNFINGVAEKQGEVIDAAFNFIIAFINGLADAIRSHEGEVLAAIANLIVAMVQAVFAGIGDLMNAASDLVGGFVSGLSSRDGDVWSAGANLVSGFINGILSMGGALWNAACSLASSAWSAISSTLDMHSPSRVALKGGRYFIQGFINGIDEMRNPTIASSSGLALAAMSALESGLKTDYSPSIVPVVDVSGVQNGISSINGLLYSMPETYGISASIANDNDLRRQLIDLMGAPNDYSDILNGMNSLREELAGYGDKLSQLQIVMDSGALVGAISQPMDISLGMRQAMVGRGVL